MEQQKVHTSKVLYEFPSCLLLKTCVFCTSTQLIWAITSASRYEDTAERSWLQPQWLVSARSCGHAIKLDGPGESLSCKCKILQWKMTAGLRLMNKASSNVWRPSKNHFKNIKRANKLYEQILTTMVSLKSTRLLRQSQFLIAPVLQGDLDNTGDKIR